jgi:hypothetical protein
MFNKSNHQSKPPLVRGNIKLVAIGGLCYSFMLKSINQDVSYKQSVSELNAVSSSHKGGLYIAHISDGRGSNTKHIQQF